MISCSRLFLLLLLRSGVQALSVRAQVQNAGKNHSADPRTLGVPYPLLVAEGQGAHTQASGNGMGDDMMGI